MSERFRHDVLSFAFLLTGIGSALLGAVLPATLHQWQLSDSRGGLLLFCAWGGSTLGAFFVRGKGANSAKLGLALAAVGMFCLALPHVPVRPLLVLLYGLGLGLTMTAISLLRSTEVSPRETNLELNRLNLLWAVGACCAPALALHSLRMLSVSGLFWIMGSALATAALLLLIGGSASATHTAPTELDRRALAPLRFCLFAAATVGLESAIGGWMTTYTQRLTHGVGVAVTTNSAFWAGLLLSRAAHSVRSLRWLRSESGLRLHLALVTLSTLMLIGVPAKAPAPLFAGVALLSGFGLGPLYPYALSLALPRFRSTAVFVCAGVGASVVPWMTGALSSATGSLRLGLAAPCAALALLLASAALMRNESSLP